VSFVVDLMFTAYGGTRAGYLIHARSLRKSLP
jgi:hypothetical protein